MAKRKTKKSPAQPRELDSVYFLKLIVYLVLGSIWIKFVNRSGSVQIGVPFGLMIGLVFAGHDHIQMDRKIGYAVLLVATLIGFWLPFGVYVNL